MKILMAASEAAPYAKTGGLADVLGALPQALAERGEEVAVVMPLYRRAAAKLDGAVRAFDRMLIPLTPELSYRVDIRRVDSRGVKLFFVDSPLLFDRDELYGESGVDYPDNHIRFAVSCRAVLGVVRSLFRPDVLHCHDWQTGLIGPYIRHQFRLDPTFLAIKILMTIHNLGYQGLFPPTVLQELGLDKSLFRPDRLEFWGKVNFLKGGLVYADAINTVSRAYAREIQTLEYGFGLDGLLRDRSDVLTGILNGVDYGEWNPETDGYLAAHYSDRDLSGKQACKADLLQTFGLPAENLKRPVIGIVSRFVHQKGFDILATVADQMMQEDVAFVALGTGEPQFEELLKGLAQAYPDRAAVKIAYDNAAAHKLEAGSDIFLMPSQYEPCGLNQIYSLRYGTVPVVRATGGLDDTIDEETGFKFQEYSGTALLEAMRAALAAWKDQAKWRRMMVAGMRRDHSWTASAAEYSALYRRLAQPAAS